MSEFFWWRRRKIGVLTLVMTLLPMGGWVRSGIVRERFTFASGTNTQQSLFSENGRLLWMSHYDPSRETIGDSFFSRGWETFRWIQFGISGFTDIDKEDGSECGWRQFGFGSGELKGVALNGEDEVVAKFWFIPYWSVVTPMTLLSAYLILSKPRIAKPKPDSFG